MASGQKDRLGKGKGAQTLARAARGRDRRTSEESYTRLFTGTLKGDSWNGAFLSTGVFADTYSDTNSVKHWMGTGAVV